jgi:hypothetical protein
MKHLPGSRFFHNQGGRGGTVELIAVALLVCVFLGVAAPRFHALFSVAERTAAKQIEVGMTQTAWLEKPKRAVQGKKPEFPYDAAELISIADVNSIEFTVNADRFQGEINHNLHTWEYSRKKGTVKELKNLTEKPKNR